MTAPVVFAVEDWFEVRSEMEPLWDRHWVEVALNKDAIKLNPDFVSYDMFAQSGMLHIVVGRKGGQIVAYHFSIVKTHLHYRQSLSGFTDIYFVLPEYRTGRTPLRLFQFVEKTLKSRGVEKLFTGTKKSLDAGRLFEFMGWVETERLYTKFIGG